MKRWIIRSLFLLPLLLCLGGWAWSVGHFSGVQRGYDSRLPSDPNYVMLWSEGGEVGVRWGNSIFVQPGWRTTIGRSRPVQVWPSCPAGLFRWRGWPFYAETEVEVKGYRIRWYDFSFLGVCTMYEFDGQNGQSLRSITVPYWLAVLVFSVPLFFVWHETRGRKINPATAFPVELVKDLPQ